MHYQPIVNLATSKVVGFEALMRWRHGERGWVPPNVFIPLAEKSDLIVELGSFALREATAAASTWNLDDRCFVTVNVSARQFGAPGLAGTIETALAKSGLSPSQLVLEITESVAMDDVSKTMRTLEYLRRRGVGVAIDDFGTGHSSLSYLVDLKPTIIKIDRSFINPSRASVRNDIVLEAILSLGHNLKVTMLAEGIETPEHLARLRRLGCELGQGYLFSPAVPASDVPGQLGERRLESIV